MKVCPKCQQNHQKDGKFCSRSCANSRGPRSQETKDKISASVKKNPSGFVLDQSKAGKLRRRGTYRTCPSCHKQFYRYPSESDKLYCSRKCNPNMGGYRKGSGRSLGGYYQGIYCHSTYELIWVMYNLHHKIPFKVCKETFEYGSGKKYYPDFEIDDIIIEIKGYHTDLVDIKTESVIKSGRKIKVLYRSDLQYCFEWFEQEYPNQKVNDFFETP